LNSWPLPYQGSALPLSYGSICGRGGTPARRRGLLCHSVVLDARPKRSYQPPDRNRRADDGQVRTSATAWAKIGRKASREPQAPEGPVSGTRQRAWRRTPNFGPRSGHGKETV